MLQGGSNTGNMRVGIALGNGDGSFAAPVSTTFGASFAHQGFAVADFNGDDRLDIARPTASVTKNNRSPIFFINPPSNYLSKRTTLLESSDFLIRLVYEQKYIVFENLYLTSHLSCVKIELKDLDETDQETE